MPYKLGKNNNYVNQLNDCFNYSDHLIPEKLVGSFVR